MLLLQLPFLAFDFLVGTLHDVIGRKLNLFFGGLICMLSLLLAPIAPLGAPIYLARIFFNFG